MLDRSIPPNVPTHKSHKPTARWNVITDISSGFWSSSIANCLHYTPSDIFDDMQVKANLIKLACIVTAAVEAAAVAYSIKTRPPYLPPSSWTNWIPFACSGSRHAGDREHTHNICRVGRLSCPVFTPTNTPAAILPILRDNGFFSPVKQQGRRKEEGIVSLSTWEIRPQIWSNRMKTRRGIIIKSFFLSTPLLLPRHWWVLREFCFRFLRYWIRLL